MILPDSLKTDFVLYFETIQSIIINVEDYNSGPNVLPKISVGNHDLYLRSSDFALQY